VESMFVVDPFAVPAENEYPVLILIFFVVVATIWPVRPEAVVEPSWEIKQGRP